MKQNNTYDNTNGICAFAIITTSVFGFLIVLRGLYMCYLIYLDADSILKLLTVLVALSIILLAPLLIIFGMMLLMKPTNCVIKK